MKSYKSFTLKTLMLTLLIIVAFCLSACSSVNIMTVFNEDNTIDELVYVKLDNTDIESAGYSILEVKEDISNTAMIEAGKLVDEYNNKIYLESILAPTIEEKNKLDLLLGGVSVVGNEWKDNTYVIGLRFRDLAAYRYYYNIPEDSETEPEVERHFFYNKVVYKGHTKYIAYSTLAINIKDKFTTKYSGLIDSENQLLYTYITDLRREHSDADYIDKINGKYYHTWIVEDDNLDKEINIYYNITNKSNCILVCVGISIVVSLILLSIGLIINRQKGKNNKSSNNKTEITE